MSLIEGREDLMTSSSRGPMSFVLSKSIVTGVKASSSSVGVSVSLSYESSSGTLKSAATSRRTRELTVIASGSIASTSAADFSALTLATMALPQVRRGRLDSSLVWMEEDTEIMMLSFSTSTIVGPNSANPKVCVNMRSSYCASKGREPTSTVSFGSSTQASYVQGGNPFLNLYADPGETNLNIQSDNATYFCVTNLLPSGVKTNDSWEIRTTFTFQIQVTNVAWTSNEDQEDTNTGFRLPPLSEVVLMDDSDVMGSDCAQTLVHQKTYSKSTLSVYSVMSITFFAVALAGAVLVTRMWNPRLHGMNWNPSLHVKDPQLLHRTMSSISEKVESGKFDMSGNGTGLSDGWAGILRFPDTEYNPIGQESVDGTQNVLALAVQLVSPIPLTHACFVELYVAENTSPEGENDVTGEDHYEDLPVLSYRRSSINPSVPRLRVKSMTVSPRQLKENSGFYITKSFQFAEGDEMVIEDMIESPLTNELPRQYLELLVTERADDLARAQAEAAGFEARVKSGLVGNLYDNLIEQIQGENDQTVVQMWLNERVQQRKMYVEALRECHQLCIDRAEEGLNFKASTEKKSLVLRFLPINLHVQDMWVGPTADLRSQRSRRTSPNVRVYPTVTVGAFAAHCFKFRHNGSILSLRATLQKRSLSRVQSDVSDKSVDVVDWTNADIRSTDETRWHLTTRFDMCFSQALTTLVTSFCRQLEYSLQHPSDRTFLRTIDSIGFLFQVESLLSTQGKEIGMLEDFSAAVDALKHVTFVLDTSPPAHLPSTLLNLHMKNTTLPGVVSVRLSKGSTKGTFTVAIGVRCSEDVRASIPSTIRSGGSITVTPVIFTQGINEMQTLANNASAKKTTLQDIINRKSFFVLTRYVEKYKQLAAQRPDAVPTPMSTIAPLLESLEERIATASKRHVVKSKHPKIIQESSHLCRLLGAGRVTSCKSAKDRTGMSVTLEQVRLLSKNHGLPEEFAVRTVSTMRSNGVRLENALKNTGKRQYAFNALQRSLLPDEYKCPEGTYGRGNVS
ncbi:Zinc transporter ZupT [Phytophthora nicotianae]|uniref:Zinc transporter ZupT n=1 Tax=Phytophthora nicotianae TaxID=4792 RepID=A0A0W8D723_PHYNI|nr:Zinc transporter ZupT [Phytophthora nicotianae]